jgi:hypothetical protein
VNIEFYVWISEVFFTQNFELQMIFMFEDALERLDLKCETHMEKSQNEFIKCINVISMPFFVLNSGKKIVYSYCFVLMKPEPVFWHENYVLELNKLRFIDQSLLKGISDDFQNNNRKQHYLSFDGTALFGDIFYRNHKRDLLYTKEIIIRQVIQIEKNLRREDLKEFYPIFLENICRAYQCLCIDDQEYLNIFENVNVSLFLKLQIIIPVICIKFFQLLVSEFQRTQKRLDTFKYRKTEAEHLVVLTMFFCTYRFNLLNQMKPTPKHWLNYIFQFHDSTNINYLQSLKEIFSFHIR